MRGLAYLYKGGEFDRAYADFGKALRLAPQYATSYLTGDILSDSRLAQYFTRKKTASSEEEKDDERKEEKRGNFLTRLWNWLKR